MSPAEAYTLFQRSPLMQVKSSEPQLMLKDNAEPYVVPEYEAGRVLAHITTDKPVYYPGEVVFVETYLVDALTKQPKIDNISFEPKISIHEYKTGKEVANSKTVGSDKVKAGTVTFNYLIPDDLTGGEYYIMYVSQ